MSTTDPTIASIKADLEQAMELLQEWAEEISTKEAQR